MLCIQIARMSVEVATTKSINPLALMGDSETVLNIVDHVTEEETTLHGQNTVTHRGVSGEYRSTKQPRKCPKFVSLVILFVAMVTAGVIMTFPLVLFHTNSSEVKLTT